MDQAHENAASDVGRSIRTMGDDFNKREEATPSFRKLLLSVICDTSTVLLQFTAFIANCLEYV
jgi:hypothetical protein